MSLVMKRQLCALTWLFTKLAADVKIPDMIVTVTKHYGVHHSYEAFKPLPLILTTVKMCIEETQSHIPGIPITG